MGFALAPPFGLEPTTHTLAVPADSVLRPSLCDRFASSSHAPFHSRLAGSPLIHFAARPLPKKRKPLFGDPDQSPSPLPPAAAVCEPVNSGGGC